MHRSLIAVALLVCLGVGSLAVRAGATPVRSQGGSLEGSFVDALIELPNGSHFIRRDDLSGERHATFDESFLTITTDRGRVVYPRDRVVSATIQ